jgi:MFS transporter, ACS family, hexuronate transporter
MTLMRPVGHYRWWVIAALLAAISAINYLDRQTLAVMIAEIKKDIAISEVQYGRMTSMFLLGYGLMYAGGGWLVDRVGVRFGYLLIAGSWSFACAGHSLVGSAFGLMFARLLLGLTEGGGFPASAKAVSEWFTPKERSLAVGIYNTGSSVGSTLAPPLIAWIALTWHWRAAFVVAGSIGLVWALVWAWIYRPVQDCRRVGAPEKAFLLEAGAGQQGNSASREPWSSLLGIKEVWVLMAARFLTGGPWYFMIFWFPKYLGDVWHFNTKEVGWYGWLPYAFAGVGSLAGGWISSWLMQRGLPLHSARRLSLGLGAFLLPAAIVIAFTPVLTRTPYLAICCACLAFLGHQWWSVIMQTLTPDLFPSRLVGSAAGLIGMAELLGSALFAEVAGRILEATSKNYTLPFILAGILHPIAFALICVVIKKIGLLDRFREVQAA